MTTLPAIGQRRLRRGRPTITRCFAKPTPSLAGDALLTPRLREIEDERDAARRCGRALAGGGW